MSPNMLQAWQIPAASLPDELWDVIVIGAGPAGATAAIHLAREGHRVLLLERAAFPRDKVCGDGLVADALKSLQALGLAEPARAVGHEMCLLSIFSASQVEFEVPGSYLTLKREVLDDLLARRAVECGATLALGRVSQITPEPDGTVSCQMTGASRACRAHVVVIATGARQELLKRLNVGGLRRPSGFAMRCYVRSTLQINHLIVSYDRSIMPGYAWIFPLGDGVYNIGCGMVFGRAASEPAHLGERFKAFTASFPQARSLMRRGEVLVPPRGALLRCGLQGAEPLPAPNILAIGETIGTTFPFTGEGIGKAMESGALAAEVIHEALLTGDLDRLGQYPQRLRQEFRPLYEGYQAAQKWFSKAWVNDFVARRVQKSGFLSHSFAGVITEDVNPGVIFSWQGMLRSFWQ